MTLVKAVAFEYEPNRAVGPLLESFRMMVNHALWAGVSERIRHRFSLIKAVYQEFKRYDLHSHYTLNACEVASAILKNHKRNHRAPVASRLFLKLDSQTFQVRGETLRIPTKARQFLTLKLKVGKYQRQFLTNPSLKVGSITLTEKKVIVAFTRAEPRILSHETVVAYDTNELSLVGAISSATGIRPIRVDLREIARVHAFHFERRRYLQSRLAHCERKLRTKSIMDRGRERRRVDAILHRVAKREVDLANMRNAKIVLEDLKGVRRSVNRRIRRRNSYNHTNQRISVHSKSLKRRLNAWPFRRLHNFMEYKARWEGVPLSYVSARYTSRACSRCGCLQTGHEGEQDPKTRQVFQCPRCGFRCDRHLNAAFNLLKTQDEGRWFSPDRLLNEVMTAKRAYEEEVKPQTLNRQRVGIYAN